ncbi:hypothetical protein ACQ4PT_038467 [Festuca glaucescens]
MKRRVVHGFLFAYWSIWRHRSTCAAGSSQCTRTLNMWGCFRRWMRHTMCASMSGLNFVKTGVTLDGDCSKGTQVDVGLSKNVLVEQGLEPGKRVTVAMGTNRDITTDCVRKVVPPSSPSEEMGSYWGYKVRYASNLSDVINGSPYKEGYDHIIGTSEHGETIISSELILPSFRHLLIAFGGLAGLEESIEEDINLKGKGANDVFTSYLNTCPNQGSRTIRTEEALLISLQYFQDPIRRAG